MRDDVKPKLSWSKNLANCTCTPRRFPYHHCPRTLLAQLTTHVPPPSVRVRRLAIGGIAASALPPRPCAAAAGRRRGRIPSALPGMMPAHLHDVVARDAHYGSGGDAPINTAQYLLDLDTGATLNFCGGMMFGLALSPMLRQHLHDVSKGGAGGD